MNRQWIFGGMQCWLLAYTPYETYSGARSTAKFAQKNTDFSLVQRRFDFDHKMNCRSFAVFSYPGGHIFHSIPSSAAASSSSSSPFVKYRSQPPAKILCACVFVVVAMPHVLGRLSSLLRSLTLCLIIINFLFVSFIWNLFLFFLATCSSRLPVEGCKKNKMSERKKTFVPFFFSFFRNFLSSSPLCMWNVVLLKIL